MIGNNRFDLRILVIGFMVIVYTSRIYADNAIGCKFESALCGPAEVCVDDAIFGQCQTEPFDLHQYDLNESEQELLRLELVRLALRGEDWPSKNVQCFLRYFFLTHRYGLTYDADFCNVRNLDNVIALLELVEDSLKNGDDQNRNNLPVKLSGDDQTDEQLINVPAPAEESSDIKKGGEFMVHARSIQNDINDDNFGTPVFYDSATPEQMVNDEDGQFFMSLDEEHVLNGYIAQMLRGETPDFSQLSSEQLQKFIAYVDLLRAAVNTKLQATQGEVVSDDEMQNADLEKLLFKKDEEKLGILDQGTGGKEHRIQTRDPREFQATPSPRSLSKGSKRVEGDRVYIKLNTNVTDAETVEQLMAYLEEKVGEPNNITFSDVMIKNNEISFKVHNVDELTPEWLRDALELPPPKLVSTAEVAEETFQLLKKDKLVVESGLGNGKRSESVVLEREDNDDGFVLPTLVVCGLVIGSLVVVLGVYVLRSRNRAKNSLQRLAADLECPPGKDYEELCRQRMSIKTTGPEPLSGIVGTLAQRLGSQSEPSPPPAYAHSTHSSTSSWNEEPVQTNMDISTGHMILTYMENHLLNKDRLEQEWKELEAYQPDVTDTSVAVEKQNWAKNRSKDVVPYDHNRVILNESSNQRNGNYINASFICDHDPRNPAYIATQAPLPETVADFWQMIWEQGSVVLVNLTKLVEGGDTKCHRYWPESGSEVYHIYEIHLVSEHIWCEDYLVRSFYLKNLKTQETRTVTQFHFLTWEEETVPSSSKALLEFRRKVNKSYRGRSCPIVVHCSNGGERTGTYCLLDMVLNRINKGVKEIDIAAALEHLRDQRMKSIGTMEQFEFVLACVAEEVQAVLKALAH